MRTERSILHKKLDRTMIYVTHNKINSTKMADQIVIMESGRVQQIGTTREVYYAPDNLFAAGFIGSPTMNFIDGEVYDGDSPAVCGDGFELPLSANLAERA